MEFALAIGQVLLMLAGAYAILRLIRRGNRYWGGTPGRPDADAIDADYVRAGIEVDGDVARGTLQSVPFVIKLNPHGPSPSGVLEIPGARDNDFSLAREGDDMRAFLRLGAGHPLQTGDSGMDPALDSVLTLAAEREAARALFHLGFDKLERKGGALRAVKYFCPHLPELAVLQRALTHLNLLR